MTRPLFAAGIAIFAVAAVAARVASAEVSKEELGKLAGTWTATAASRGGKAVEGDELKALKVVFEVDKMIIKTGDKDRTAVIKGLDVSKTPAEFDFAPLMDKEEGPTMKGIYKLDGDTLKLAFARGEGERPTKFDAGENVAMMELKKAN